MFEKTACSSSWEMRKKAKLVVTGYGGTMTDEKWITC
jgi:hypothetical protein